MQIIGAGYFLPSFVLLSTNNFNELKLALEKQCSITLVTGRNAYLDIT